VTVKIGLGLIPLLYLSLAIYIYIYCSADMVQFVQLVTGLDPIKILVIALKSEWD